MEDDELFLDWVENESKPLTCPELGVITGKTCPPGGIKTGVFLDNVQQETLNFLKQEIELAKEGWQAYENLGPADQKVLPFRSLCVQCKRCELLAKSFWLSVEAAVSPKFYGFVGIGFDETFEIWVGPNFKRSLQDLRSAFDLYSQRS